MRTAKTAHVYAHAWPEMCVSELPRVFLGFPYLSLLALMCFPDVRAFCSCLAESPAFFCAKNLDFHINSALFPMEFCGPSESYFMGNIVGFICVCDLLRAPSFGQNLL